MHYMTLPIFIHVGMQHLILCVIEIHVDYITKVSELRAVKCDLHLWKTTYNALKIRYGPMTKERRNGNVTPGTKNKVSSRPRYDVAGPPGNIRFKTLIQRCQKVMWLVTK